AIHMFGDVISRGGVGVLSDNLGHGRVSVLAGVGRAFGVDPVREHLTTALLVVPAALLVSAFFFYWGGRKYANWSPHVPLFRCLRFLISGLLRHSSEQKKVSPEPKARPAGVQVPQVSQQTSLSDFCFGAEAACW